MSVSAVAEVPRGPLLKRGNTVTILCNVTVATSGPSQVEVAWLYRRESKEGLGEKPLADDPGRHMATLTYDGLTRLHANDTEISVDRLAPHCFRLRVHAARVEDQGHYQCQAGVWAQDPKGAWYYTGARAESATVRLYLYARGETQDFRLPAN